METSSKIVKIPEEIIKGALFNCQDCAQCHAALHGHDLSDELPEEPAQRAVRRRAPERALRSQAGDGVRVGRGHSAGRRRPPTSTSSMRLNPPVDIRLKGQASLGHLLARRDKIPTGTDVEVRYADEALEKGKALNAGGRGQQGRAGDEGGRMNAPDVKVTPPRRARPRPPSSRPACAATAATWPRCSTRASSPCASKSRRRSAPTSRPSSARSRRSRATATPTT